jgi:ribonuclease T1
VCARPTRSNRRRLLRYTVLMLAMTSRRTVAALALAAFLGAGSAVAKSTPDALPEIAAATLPKEAQKTLTLIAQGGPFPYHRDGVVFGNRERRLPAHARGYYHEYTVPTPGARTRGARRIICGGDVRSVAECYYSNDHYETFRRIRP